MKRSLLPVAVAAVALGVAGCGSSPPVAPEAPPAAASAAPSATPAVSAPAPAPAPGVPPLTGSPTDLTAPSQAKAGTGKPPTKLVTQDIVIGSGPKATAADTVDVQYTGTLWDNGTVFDSSWSRGAPATFPLNGVVPGFAQGIEGMQVGGRRVIVIPPDLGYGDKATGPIPGGSTLVFVVDLVGIGS